MLHGSPTPQPRCQALRLPADLRSAGLDALVPPDAADEQVAQRLALVLGLQPLRHRPAAARPGGRADAGLGRGAAAADAGGAAEETVAADSGTGPDPAVTAVRAIRRRELFRISVADLLGLLDVGPGRLRPHRRHARHPRGRAGEPRSPPSPRSGAVTCRCRSPSSRWAGTAVAARLRQRRRRHVRLRAGRRCRCRAGGARRRDDGRRAQRLLSLPGTDRPSRSTPGCARGRAGAAGAAIECLRRLLREVVGGLGGAGAAAGKPQRRDQALAGRFRELIEPCGSRRRDQRRRRAEGAPDQGARRRRAARRASRPATHLKLGRGSLSDVEWTVQLLQIQHAGRSRRSRTTRTWSARGRSRRRPAPAVDAQSLAPPPRAPASGLRNAVAQCAPAATRPRDAGRPQVAAIQATRRSVRRLVDDSCASRDGPARSSSGSSGVGGGSDRDASAQRQARRNAGAAAGRPRLRGYPRELLGLPLVDQPRPLRDGRDDGRLGPAAAHGLDHSANIVRSASTPSSSCASRRPRPARPSPGRSRRPASTTCRRCGALGALLQQHVPVVDQQQSTLRARPSAGAAVADGVAAHASGSRSPPRRPTPGRRGSDGMAHTLVDRVRRPRRSRRARRSRPPERQQDVDGCGERAGDQRGGIALADRRRSVAAAPRRSAPRIRPMTAGPTG